LGFLLLAVCLLHVRVFRFCLNVLDVEGVFFKFFFNVVSFVVRCSQIWWYFCSHYYRICIILPAKKWYVITAGSLVPRFTQSRLQMITDYRDSGFSLFRVNFRQLQIQSQKRTRSSCRLAQKWRPCTCKVALFYRVSVPHT